MSADHVRATIKDFIRDRFLIGRPADYLRDSDSFLEKGVLDSTGVLELVGFIEETFGFSVEDEELTPECLGSVDNVVGYITRKAGLAT